MTDDELAYDGVCPVCGCAFGDGFDDIDGGETVTGTRICVIEKDENGGIADGIIHLPQEVSEDTVSLALTEADAYALREYTEAMMAGGGGYDETRKRIVNVHEQLDQVLQ